MDEKFKRSDAVHFETTNWSVVLAAGRESSPDARRSLETLCQRYWFPLYAFVRRRGRSEADAKDLVQSFILDLLNRNDFKSANKEKGKFRTFLLAALNHFLANEHNFRSAKKRGGDKTIVSIEWTDAESRYANEPFENETPERAFDRQWAFSIIDRALATLYQELSDSDQQSHFAELSGFLIGDSNRKPETYAEIGRRLNMSESAVKSAIHRIRGRYRKILRSQIADTVETREQIDEEINALFTALRRS